MNTRESKQVVDRDTRMESAREATHGQAFMKVPFPNVIAHVAVASGRHIRASTPPGMNCPPRRLKVALREVNRELNVRIVLAWSLRNENLLVAEQPWTIR